MPIYVYQVVSENSEEGAIFEVEQPMSEPSLTQHPVTGEKVKRVYLPPNLGIKYTPGSTEKKLETSNIEKAGFTRYERDKLTGTYHKTAGLDQRAPDTLKSE